MKNKKMAAGIAGLAIVALVGGSLAYFNQTMSASNNFSTKQYGSTLTEDFTPVSYTHLDVYKRQEKRRKL